VYRLIAILLLITSLNGYGQSPMTVSLANTPGPVVPGGHITLLFDVKSPSPLPDSLGGEIQLPEKWRLLSQRRPVRTVGDQSLRYFYVIGTPAVCTSGDYQVKFILNANGGQIATHVALTVGQIRNIEVFVVTQPEFIREGDTLRLTYLVRNSGNNPEKFLLKSDHGKIENVTDSLTLEPGASTNVTVSQIIPHTDNNAWQASPNLSVLMANRAEPVYSVTSIPVFSSKVKKIDRYFRFPVEVGGAYLSYRYGGRQVTPISIWPPAKVLSIRKSAIMSISPSGGPTSSYFRP
jgi:hypothetical protein